MVNKHEFIICNQWWNELWIDGDKDENEEMKKKREKNPYSNLHWCDTAACLLLPAQFNKLW